MRGRSRFRAYLLPGLVGFAAATAYVSAETQQQPAPAPPVTTLHVYMELVQVPVLVLGSYHERMKPIDPAKFRVSLDSGRPFSPQHVRQQGDDAISLTIFLDATGQQAPLMPKLDALIAALAPDSLHAIDHVSIFVLDCGLTRSIYDAPATPDRLHGAIDAALKERSARIEDHKSCTYSPPLWDEMARAMKQLAELPGRRIMLAITDGIDRGRSITMWSDLKDFAQIKSISIFGLAPTIPPIDRSAMGRIADAKSPSTEDPFNLLCQLSGGIVLQARLEDLDRQLHEFVAMVRERYILDFARPRNDSIGKHSIDVSLVKTLAFICPAGVAYAVLDHANDPSTIPRDTTNAPEEGKRKILTPSTPPN